MPKAGYCSECKANVWLRTDGSCVNGHGPECLSEVYEADALQAAQPSAAAATKPGPFSGIPLWARVLLAVVFLPFAIIYGIYVMWRDQKFSPAARLVLTAIGGLLAFAMFASAAGQNTTTPTPPPSPPAATAPVATPSGPESAAPAADSTEPASQMATIEPPPPAPEAVTPPPAAPPAPQAKPAPSPSPKVEVTVYKTRTGSKYHMDGCQYLSKSKIPISLDDAKAEGLGP